MSFFYKQTNKEQMQYLTFCALNMEKLSHLDRDTGLFEEILSLTVSCGVWSVSLLHLRSDKTTVKTHLKEQSTKNVFIWKLLTVGNQVYLMGHFGFCRTREESNDLDAVLQQIYLDFFSL